MAAARKPPALPPVRRNSAARNRQIARLQSRLGELWDELRIPSWHRVLFEEKYCRGEYGPDVLAREIRALRAGTALVQRVLEAINNRQEILVWLTLLRTGYDDTEFLTAGTLPRRHLSQQLQALRFASVSVVELLSAWRSFVAPRPGKHQLGFGGPVARGALWPHVGPRGDLEDEDEDCEDYLLHLARDDTVVRCFDTVLEVSPECDPLLLHGSIGGVGWKESGKLCPPPADAVQRARLERARLMLLEEEDPHQQDQAHLYDVDGEGIGAEGKASASKFLEQGESARAPARARRAQRDDPTSQPKRRKKKKETSGRGEVEDSKLKIASKVGSGQAFEEIFFGLGFNSATDTLMRMQRSSGTPSVRDCVFFPRRNMRRILVTNTIKHMTSLSLQRRPRATRLQSWISVNRAEKTIRSSFEIWWKAEDEKLATRMHSEAEPQDQQEGEIVSGLQDSEEGDQARQCGYENGGRMARAAAWSLVQERGRVLAEVSPESMQQAASKITALLSKAAYDKLQVIRLNPAAFVSKADAAPGDDDTAAPDVADADAKVYSSADFTRSIAGSKCMDAFLSSLPKVWAGAMKEVRNRVQNLFHELEYLVALSTFASAPPTRSRESTSSTLPKTVYMESLTAPLRLPLPGAPATLLNDLISEWRDKLVSSQASLPIGDRPVLSAVLRSYSREENASQEPCGEGKLKRGGTPQPARPRRSHLGAQRWRPQTR
ncbi:hypothetical protein AK812_SmicGene8270 [Symbiodinium microadriaticum]|uniref:Uncharacterized protein n=2 Tax=Symbiodinium TaxID=2949 RepID=A0A1Q9ELD1_SYMMI|nr:hypothetical protein AK812_SmicGene8270 [Symbiodinium microadriaticum]